MATFLPVRSDVGTSFTFTFINHSSAEMNLDIRAISSNPQNYGNVGPGQQVSANLFVTSNLTLEYGNVPVVGIGLFGQPQLVPVPGVRFWSGFNFPVKDQYINLLEGNGWSVTKDTSTLSEVTGNGFRVTVDGGGQEPTTDTIFFQVYNA